MPKQIKDNGFRVDLGDVDEIAHHYRRHFHQFLDYLTIDPSAPNPLDQVGDGEPALRDAMRRAGGAVPRLCVKQQGRQHGGRFTSTGSACQRLS